MSKSLKLEIIKKIVLISQLLILAIISSTPEAIAQEPKNKVVLNSQVEWTYLNPARKDKAPMAGTLWGDRNGTGATGFLLKPKDGFQSPPHIHNVSYRGIVINGLIHNDDPNATNMWMPPGSFWTQPKGEIHITSAKGNETLAYIEIEEGPYLVHPSDKAFDSGERPVNVDKSNIVWLDASEIKWIDEMSQSSPEKKVQIAFLWEEIEEQTYKGTLLKLPKGYKGKIISYGSSFGSVVIKGNPKYSFSNDINSPVLEVGSYFSSEGKSYHHIASDSDEETILYIRTNNKYKTIAE